MFPIPPNEQLIETKTCKHCRASFPITDKDMEFYEKVSPVFAGKKYSIPTPTLCPDCRQQRRLSFRNERKLYKRKCDATRKDIISIYSSDKLLTVYHGDYWWSDKCDPKDYGMKFDFIRSFFDQFSELQGKVPLLDLTVAFESENSKYATFSGKMKDCYMVYASWEMEKTMYSSSQLKTTNVVDSLNGTNLEQCYQILNCESCFWCVYCINSNYCSDSYFLYNCENCMHCFMCSNLVWKKYYIENQEYSKDEYLEKVQVLKWRYLRYWWDSLKEIKDTAINKSLIMLNSENSLWDNIKGCKNCNYVFRWEDSQDCKYCENWWIVCSQVYDCYGAWATFSRGYELIDSWVDATLTCFGIGCYNCGDSFYNINCHNSPHIFGCVWLRNASYCILNKQYTKEEYETLVPKIIEHMMKTGEWGEFFPSSLSPFGYNETVAQEYFPLTKEQATKDNTFNWSDYEAPFPKVEKIIPANKLPEDISKIPDDILNWAIECEVTKKPFRIIRQELEFYRKHQLPIPRRHPDQRHLDRMALRNPRKLFERKCDKCGKDMITTYAPERPETVYCEECYNREVIG